VVELVIKVQNVFIVETTMKENGSGSRMKRRHKSYGIKMYRNLLCQKNISSYFKAILIIS